MDIPQEPCKYDLDIWDKNSVNLQFKLNEKCRGINHSDRILQNNHLLILHYLN